MGPMVTPECLNPKDVLLHLNSLGYHNITAKQLKEFIHDLKKLIKYDQKKISQNVSFQQPDSKCTCSQCDESLEKLSTDGYVYDSESVCSSSATFSHDKQSKIVRSSKPCSHNPTEFEIAQKAQISFIRPWNLHTYKDFSGKGRRNLDPVRLYHHYKECWNRQNIPGESKHSDLRWVIRNRMLGQEPNPKVHIINH